MSFSQFESFEEATQCVEFGIELDGRVTRTECRRIRRSAPFPSQILVDHYDDVYDEWYGDAAESESECVYAD